jgi:uncharacterized membrane protein
LLLVVLAAGGLVWLLVQGFALLSHFGVEPGVVVIVLVLVGVAVSVYRAKRDGYL